MPAEQLRYYFAAKLSNSIDDIDLNLEDFQVRSNSELVGKLVNIASRCAGFVNKRFDNTLASELPDPELYATFANLSSAEHSYAISLDQNQGPLLINNKLINLEIDKSNDMIYPPNF